MKIIKQFSALMVMLIASNSPVAEARYVQADPIGLAGGSWSTYAYVNGNPISKIDTDGRRLAVASDVSDSARKAYEDVLAELKTDESVRNMLSIIENSPVEILVHMSDGDGADGLINSFQKRTVKTDMEGNIVLKSADIDWMHNTAVICKKSTYVSPMLTLLHELGHAYYAVMMAKNIVQYIELSETKRYDGYGNEIDYLIIKDIEAPFAKRHCECERNSHGVPEGVTAQDFYRHVDSPFDH